jgi:hypothetical protein
VHYEDVVTRPAEILPGLFSFLGVGWDPDLIDQVYKTPHDPGGGDIFVQYAGRIRSDSVGGGRGLPFQLIPEQLLLQLKELDRELGYADLIAKLTKIPDLPTAAAAPGDGNGQIAREVEATGSVKGPRWVFESHLPARLHERRTLLASLGSSYRFVISGNEGGTWLLLRHGDGFQVVADGPAAGNKAATTLGITSADLLGLVNGAINAGKIVQEGRLAISGQPPTLEAIQALLALVRTDI